MRVLLTCEDYFPHLGGAEVCIFNLRKELRLLGHEVTVFTNTTMTTSDDDGVVRLAWSFSPRGLWKNVRTLWMLVGANDLTHSMYSFRIACLVSLIARLRRKPMLLTQQGKGIVPEVNPRFVDAILVKICQHVSMRFASHITSTSDEITDLTAAFVPRSKITLVSNGYDASLFTPSPSIPIPPEFAALPQGITKLLTIRRLVPKNGIHILVQALALVARERTDFHYFAIGEGRTHDFVLQLVEEFGLANHVTLLGKRGNDELLPFYQHADILLVPSSAEARSIACIEAMGMAKPIIASRVGGLIDLIGRDNRYGELVSIYDSEACTYDPPERLPTERLSVLADAIIECIKNPEPLRAKAVAAAAYVSKEYSWRTITSQYVCLYERLMARS